MSPSVEEWVSDTVRLLRLRGWKGEPLEVTELRELEHGDSVFSIKWNKESS